MALHKSYERQLEEFVQDIIINNQEIQDGFSTFPTLTANPKYNVFCAIDPDNPPAFLLPNKTFRAVVVIWKVDPVFHEDKTIQRYKITLSVGHRDEGSISLGDGNEIQRGKVNNADISEKITSVVCAKLMREWIQKTRCNANISQILDNFFPNFVHEIVIEMDFKKSYRSPLF